MANRAGLPYVNPSNYSKLSRHWVMLGNVGKDHAIRRVGGLRLQGRQVRLVWLYS